MYSAGVPVFQGYHITVADSFSPVKWYPGGTISMVIWYQGGPDLRGYQITVTPPIFGLQGFFVLGHVNIYCQPLRMHIGVSTSAAQFGAWPFRMIMRGPKNQHVIFSPQSVHGSVHVSDSIPLSNWLCLSIYIYIYIYQKR